jgi:hypothetical protein
MAEYTALQDRLDNAEALTLIKKRQLMRQIRSEFSNRREFEKWVETNLHLSKQQAEELLK